jgi:hypothetical protein
MKTSKIYFNWEMQQLLTDIAYVNLGLVPPSHYPRGVKESLISSLNQLDPSDARKAKRKFRKLRRKACGEKDGDLSYDTRQSRVKWYIIDRYIKMDAVDNDE